MVVCRLPRGKNCFIPSGNVKIEWTNYIISRLMQGTFRGLIHGWRWVLLLCRVSQRCTEKRSLRISSSHLDRRRNYACHSFSGDAQTPVTLRGWAACQGKVSAHLVSRFVGSAPTCVLSVCLNTAEFCDCDSETCACSREVYIYIIYTYISQWWVTFFISQLITQTVQWPTCIRASGANMHKVRENIWNFHV